MNQDRHLEKQLEDLLFELNDAGRSKFLFALCDESRLRHKLLERIDKELAKPGRVSTISVAPDGRNLFRAILTRRIEGVINGIHILGLEELSSPSLTRVLGELNFHRDALTTTEVPIIFWLSNKLLPRMIASAPDLWSRRGAVYHFSQTTTKAFLESIFSQSSSDGRKWKPEPILSDAFKRIFSAEKALARCLKDRKLFSLPKADGLIREINSGVDDLTRECERGRQIEVALWLWNLSHLDGELQEMLDELEPSQRIQYESLYTDRNEALLYLSKKLPDILKRYRDSLGKNIKSKRWIGLLARSRDVAASQLTRMARELSFSGEIPISLDSDPEAYFSGQFAWTESLPDSLFLRKAASDLEEWLAGLSKTRPAFLSAEEAELLRLLYLNSGKPDLVAKSLDLPVANVKRGLEALEQKVALYLGVVPTPK